MTVKKKYCIQCFSVLPAEANTCEQCHYSQIWPPTPAFLKPPYLLNQQYVMGRVLGQGGFAITYLAYDRHLRTRIAIKEYLPVEFATRGLDGSNIVIHTGKSKELFQIGKEKFIAEARMLATFRSPHIIKIRQFFEANQTAYFAMEYLEGLTLTEYIKQQGGKLSFNQARDLLLPLLDGLEEVHLANTYHRDIKPDNIYITHQGIPILLDFGSARQTVSGVTSNLMAFLTPGYSPIEQYSVHGVQGPWTDIYALAATFYFMLTGHPPPNPQDRVIGDLELVPPSQLGSDILPQQESWLLKGLAIRWSDRPSSIKVWREALKQTPSLRGDTLDLRQKQQEEKFVQTVITPLLHSHQLSLEDEETIYTVGASMQIPYVRVRLLIEEALIQTQSIRVTAHVEKEELERKKAALADEAAQRQEIQAAQDAERKRLKASRELELTEAALLEKAQYLKALEERLDKEWALKQKEMELLQWEEKLKAQTQAQNTAAESPPPEPELEDLSEEELNDLLALFSDPLKSTDPFAEIVPDPEILSLNAYYQQLLTRPAAPKLKPLLVVSQSHPPKLTNQLGMTFVLISPKMVQGPGFIFSESYQVGPQPTPEQILIQPFYLQTTLVTQKQWQAVMKNKPALFTQNPENPIEQVSWEDCQIFIQLLNQTQEAHYRLPWEVEWDYACRAGSTSIYHFGDDPSQLDEYAWYRENAGAQTHPVAQKSANAWGLYDMHGNLREWLQDPYTPWPEDEFQPRLQNAHVVRGGAWDYPEQRCTIQYRGGEKAGERKDNLGFRLVIALP